MTQPIEQIREALEVFLSCRNPENNGWTIAAGVESKRAKTNLKYAEELAKQAFSLLTPSMVLVDLKDDKVVDIAYEAFVKQLKRAGWTNCDTAYISYEKAAIKAALAALANKEKDA